MANAIDSEIFFKQASKFLNERSLRLATSAAAMGMGYGGISQAATLAGLSRPTVYAGIEELKSAAASTDIPEGGQRRRGAGRKAIDEGDTEIVKDLEGIVQPYEHGDPESPLRWTSKSLRRLADELGQMGHKVSHMSVKKLLRKLGYTLQSNKKSKEGGTSPDRDAQFNHINDTAQEFIAEGQPVISVDAKKKELIGEYKNNGREYRPQGRPESVNVYDFIDPEQGKATPYGVYDVGANKGYVGVGISHDTAEFAVETIKRWWTDMGMELYPDAHSLFITADGGGSNGSRNRLWKVKLQEFADKFGLNVFVSHFPPGTSKWNKIEHRMFSAISMNWRGKPLVSLEVIVNLIAGTTTTTGLEIKAEIDRSKYQVGEKVADAELNGLNILRHAFHPEWNYAVMCRKM